MELKERLEILLGVPVDLVTRKALHPTLREAIDGRLSVSREWRLYPEDIAEALPENS